MTARGAGVAQTGSYGYRSRAVKAIPADRYSMVGTTLPAVPSHVLSSQSSDDLLLYPQGVRSLRVRRAEPQTEWLLHPQTRAFVRAPLDIVFEQG